MYRIFKAPLLVAMMGTSATTLGVFSHQNQAHADTIATFKVPAQTQHKKVQKQYSHVKTQATHSHISAHQATTKNQNLWSLLSDKPPMTHKVHVANIPVASHHYQAKTTHQFHSNNVPSTSVSTTQSTTQSTQSSAESAARNWIANNESGGNYQAQNGQYYGKYQLSSSYLHGDYSARNQEATANSYVHNRYGSWVNAKQHWVTYGWY